MVLLMASEDVKTSESAVSTMVNLAEEAKLTREGVKAPSHAILSMCKTLVAWGVAGGVFQYVGLNFAVYESLKDWLIRTRPFGLD
ncbi:hypothetical protein F0562_019326 [Nyssa sinensis]|uniref:Uncharacterized protein n=1 Tax=Nyssa sinensis TaxID=561372 RepID=A0A5J4ZFZ9_9ASTE|nr:hypothetical protein F0562_019326 [Nyssa sinensis]